MRRSLTKLIFTALLTGGAVAVTTGFSPPHGVDGTSPAKIPFKNWGLINAESSAHIHAMDAWKIEEG
ncbi:MAG: hypothetical protein ACXVBC_14220, partial [Bdellovibrionota bacterium]